MKIRNLIDYVCKIKPNSFGDEEFIMWINEIEALVHTKVFLLRPEEFIEFTVEDIDNESCELSIKGAHAKIYSAYLVAMVDFANGEYNKYANTLEMFNAFFTDLQVWQRQYTAPADGECEFRGYYLSAYGIARKHGYSGTEKEWIDSLSGRPGLSAYEIAVELGYTGTKEEWIAYLEAAQSQKIEEASDAAISQIENLKKDLCEEMEMVATNHQTELADNTEGCIQNIKDECSSAISRIEELSYEHCSGIDSMAIDAVQRIENEKDLAIQEFAESIGITQETGLSETAVMSQKASSNLFAHAIKETASGEVVGLTDVSPIEHEMGVKLIGKNLIPFPYTNMYVEKNESSITTNDDGSIVVDTVGDYVDFVIADSTSSINLEHGETYTLSGGLFEYTDPTGEDNQDSIKLRYKKADGRVVGVSPGSSFTWDKSYTFESISFDIPEACTCHGTVPAPQLEKGTTATAYTPYIDDFTAVKVKKFGKNLIDTKNPAYKLNAIYEVDSEGVVTLTRGDLATGASGAYVSRAYWELGNYDDFVGKTFVASLDVTEKSVAKSDIVYIIADFNTKTANNIKVTSFSTTGKYTLSFTVPENTGGWKTLGLHIYCESLGTKDSTGEYIKFKDLQLEAGTTATECEEYKEPTEYSVNADGTVEGVTSLCPTTTLMTDTAGAIIDAEYNVDTKKYIDKKFAELQALLLEV